MRVDGSSSETFSAVVSSIFLSMLNACEGAE